MSKYNLKHGEHFSYIENVISDEEIDRLMNHWENIDIGEVIDYANWDVWSPKKTYIKHPLRHVEIVGVPVGGIEFLSDRIRSIFSLTLKYDFGIEGPHYFTKYPTGGFHAEHTDFGVHNGVERNAVITIQLTDSNDYTGGDLVINGESAPRTKGTFILYNGNDPHEVTKVTDGIRFSITECAGEKK